MNDQFLYLLREQPDPEFAQNLHKKLSSHDYHPQGSWKMVSAIFKGNRKTKLCWITAMLAIVFITAMTISPVRAIILTYPAEIAGRIFAISNDYPYQGNDVKTIEPRIMSLDKALAVFPYDVVLPDNVPAAYVLDKENVSVYSGNENLPETLIVSWKNGCKSLSLFVCGSCEWTHGEIVAPDAVEEVLLDNQYPAVLIRGGWYENEKAWNYDAALTLEWRVKNMLYSLSTGKTDGLTPEQLIEIALSTIR